MSAPPETLELLDDAAVADPYPLLAHWREHDPVRWSERYRSWFVTRYADVDAALRDPRFSSDRISPYRRARGRAPGDPRVEAAFAVLEDWMVFQDPPRHGRLRRLLGRAFTPRAVQRLRPRIAELTDRLLDDVAAAGSADLIADLAYPLTASVVAELLGVPADDLDRFKSWSDRITGLVFGGLGDPDRHTDGAEGMAELTGYLAGLVERDRTEPAGGLLGALLRARDGDDTLTHDEVVATGVLLLFAGHETTTNLIGNGVLALIRHPGQAPDAPGTVEEVLRFDGPAKTIARLMIADVELGGRTLRRGDRVFLCPAAANRDPEVFPDPDRFDVTRTPGRQLGFGLGLHYCLGAPLARLEASIAIPAVFDRLGSPVVDGPLRWQPVLLSRGLDRLPVRITPA
ncbi:cytochrome P450 [Pseudonocardia kongjuensis]|uniref:Cytochrome P450 n=1 Tax=Pseudonocardia kongjuensis TaxID=102227 RepID=A0ABN1XFZ2_9PSEU